jgi:hypothetical protein
MKVASQNVMQTYVPWMWPGLFWGKGQNEHLLKNLRLRRLRTFLWATLEL